MTIRRETLRVVVGAVIALTLAALLFVMFNSMASKTKEISPVEALAVETSFTEPTALPQTDDEVAKEQENRDERVEACREDVKQIGEAVEEANEQGTPATTVMDLEQQGFLDEVPVLAPVLLYSLEVDQGRPTGVVLVNGAPGPVACDS